MKKYVVLLCDGMADLPVSELGEKTPMEAAYKPNMDSLARVSELGLVKTVDDSLSPGSDVANLSVMGYDPMKYYTGRSPLEAVSMGIAMEDNDVAFRCSLVTLSNEEKYADKTMVDYCAGDISSEEAAEILKTVDEELGDEILKFYPGVSYRGCLVVKEGKNSDGDFTPPHDISGRVVGEYLPKNQAMLQLMKKSYDIMSKHPVNLKRVAECKNPANSVWFWGNGKKTVLDNFDGLYGLKGAIVSAVDLVKGIGISAGMEVCEVKGATGYIDTNFEGKAQAAIDALKNGSDYVYIHVEAPDECGHRGEAENKVKAIELIDEKILAPLKNELDKYEDYTLAILPDHPTPLCTKTHSREPVPYLIYRKNQKADGAEAFSEKTAKDSGNFVEQGCLLIKKML